MIYICIYWIIYLLDYVYNDMYLYVYIYIHIKKSLYISTTVRLSDGRNMLTVPPSKTYLCPSQARTKYFMQFFLKRT